MSDVDEAFKAKLAGEAREMKRLADSATSLHERDYYLRLWHQSVQDYRNVVEPYADFYALSVVVPVFAVVTGLLLWAILP